MGLRELDIAGLGAVTGYGWGREQLWEGLAAAKPAACPQEGYGENGQAAAWAALVPDGGEPSDGPSRFQRAMRFAAREAIADATQRGWQPGRRVGLLHAVVLGEVDLWKDFYLAHDGRVSVRNYLALMPSTPISTLMQEYGFHGPAMNVGAMCASGNAGLLTAKAWVDSGIVDDVIFVATDLSVTPENLRHFAELGVAITDTEPLQACRPFQEGSQGFIMGEGSVAMVLSRSTPHPYLHVLGGAMSHDAHHVTSIDPELTDITHCFTQALDNAGIAPEQVRYLNAHGPGTRQCDRAEAAVFDALFPATAELYSIKPLAGHCQGAASAVEIAATALGYDHELLPAPPLVADGHPRLLSGPTPPAAGLTIKSSIGMGGHNSAVVLKPPQLDTSA
ncbi:beta-ketoacyl synthase N-terminal-like domain-containing protein [Saccharopolyspora sp. TS4A08]|uniref:Beta-ketoacyl synthase N-terminal-like domain-containing protein n=1 Tax=Saccharopolyspora ipomoeae TaxID=3042027 RepID=A0ABT6PQA7_9PSEU|nr:beta-ketoacyl synthase N-terminal-like domain-containing protein [Saccharopolyspora sp. TS4A08]MDI2030197.1 beta-ketoacyl synthase N-terminal-like domain-containing protein [Saccharopolyspora sp. TS4A08]